ncbi:elicitor [Fusarium coicis]|nr:elicitor [Fusarium coicis]
MKFTALATAIFALGFGAEMATAAECCQMKVCDKMNLGGNCKHGCYPIRKTAKLNLSGLKSSVSSAKTENRCFCTIGKEVYAKGTNVPNHCLSGAKYAYCQFN